MSKAIGDHHEADFETLKPYFINLFTQITNYAPPVSGCKWYHGKTTDNRLVNLQSVLDEISQVYPGPGLYGRLLYEQLLLVAECGRPNFRACGILCMVRWRLHCRRHPPAVGSRVLRQASSRTTGGATESWETLG